MNHKENNREDTHTTCQNRLEKEGAKARCCYCVPHEGCNLKGQENITSMHGRVSDNKVTKDKDEFSGIDKIIAEKQEAQIGEKWEREFDETFDSRFNPAGFQPKTHAYMPVAKLKSFISSLLSTHDSELREKIEGMRCSEMEIKDFGEWTAHSYQEKMLVNAVLYEVIQLLDQKK